MGGFATCQIIIYVNYSSDHVRPYLCSCSHWEEFLCYKQDRWFKSQYWGVKNIEYYIHILIEGLLHLKPPKFEHIFVAVITFSPFLLCKYF